MSFWVKRPSMKALILISAVIAFVAGCSTVKNAREKQAEAKNLSSDNGGRAEKVNVDLSGCAVRALVEFALTNRPVMVSSRLEVENARLALKRIKSSAPLASDSPWTSPTLGFSASQDARNSDQDFSDAFRTEKGDFSSALSLDILLWDFGRYSASAAAAKERIISAEMELVKAGHEVFREVVDAYFATLEADALYEVALTNEAECALHLDRAIRRVEEGEAKELDVLKARLDLSIARESVCAASNNVATAAAGLIRSLGLEAAMTSRDKILPRKSSALYEMNRVFAETDASAETLFMYARTNAPAMRVSRAELRAAISAVDAEIANLYPEISASASLSWVDPVWTFRWGASFVQSLFQGMRKTTAVDEAVVAMRKAEANTIAAEHALALEISLQCAARDNAREANKRARQSLKEAKENLALSRSRYEIGEADRVDFSEAVSACSDALGACVSAYYASQRAEAAFFPLTGNYPVYDEGSVPTEGN